MVVHFLSILPPGDKIVAFLPSGIKLFSSGSIQMLTQIESAFIEDQIFYFYGSENHSPNNVIPAPVRMNLD